MILTKGIFFISRISKLAQLKTSDLIKTERPANRCQSSLQLELGSLNVDLDINVSTSQLNEFLESMVQWEGQVQDSDLKDLEPKSAKKRISKKT